MGPHKNKQVEIQGMNWSEWISCFSSPLLVKITNLLTFEQLFYAVFAGLYNLFIENVFIMTKFKQMRYDVYFIGIRRCQRL